jgi:2-polyprenyl-3-methyl-5-hydroxy-6-metoxy-1,4-benzoquinol methylase
MYECEACGFAFQPERAIDVTRLYGDDYFATYEQGRPYARKERERRLEARARVRFVRRFAHGGRLLELGAAAGYFVAEASRAGFSAVGLEPNEQMVRLGRERLNADLQVGRAEDAGTVYRGVDVICAWHVLEHVVHPRQALQKLSSASAPGGLIFLEVPNFASVRATRDREAWRYLDPAHHVGQYTPEALRSLLVRAGFEPLEITTVPWAEYKRWPRSVLSYARQASVVGRSTFRPDPWKHELLRAVGRRTDR